LRPDIVRRPRKRISKPAPAYTEAWAGNSRDLLERLGSPPQQNKTPFALIFLGLAILMAALVLRPAPSRYAVASSNGILFIVGTRSGYVTPCVVDSDKARCLGAGHIVDALMEQAGDTQ
jgi:hypothetical protein